MRQLFVKTPAGGFFPADQEAREYAAHIPVGEELFMECRRPRNPSHHRKAMAVFQLVAQSSDEYPTVEDVLLWTKLAVHHYDEHVTEDGVLVYVPKSISFASMSQDEFEQFYSRALEALRRKFLPTMDDATLDQALAFYGNGGGW